MRFCIAICTGLTLFMFIGLGAIYGTPSPEAGTAAWTAGNPLQGRGDQRSGDEDEVHGHGPDRGYSNGEQVNLAFSVYDQQVIRNYFRENPSDLPPGLAKRGGNLPPGLEKHLRRNGTLPPGLQKRLQPCPFGLERRLPPLPEGYSRKLLGTQLLILDNRNVIGDIMTLSR